MEIFEYKNGVLHIENVSLARIAASYDTPCYVYSAGYIKDRIKSYQAGFADKKHLVCYSVKANSNLSILKLIKDTGAGFDIVSGGELARVLAVGAEPEKIVFSGVGKTALEIQNALEAKIACFNVESEQELVEIARIARELKLTAPVSLRVNPDVDAKTHPYIATGLKDNKFGIDINEALRIYLEAKAIPSIKIIGIDCHIGSQLTSIEPYIATLERLLGLADKLLAAGIELEHIDLGGGLGVTYHDEQPPAPEEFSSKINELIGDKFSKIIIEPGRSIVANSGIFLTRVLYLKHNLDKNFCVVDGAMNDLIRPSLYSVWHDILPITKSASRANIYNVVGPVCETGDFLGQDRSLAIMPDELLAVMGAGAYGFVMASNYNSRPRPAEILVDDAEHRLIRPRETVVDMFATELKSL